MEGGDKERTHLLDGEQHQQQHNKDSAVASKDRQQQQQTPREEAADTMSDRHPSEELDIPGEMASESNKPNKKGLKLQLNVREAVKHNQHVWKQQQQQQQLLTPGSSRGTPKPMNVAVFVKEGQGHLLLLEKGKITTAGEIKMMMLEVLSIPKTSSHVFSIWFISPHLELQLKDHHIPFLLRKQWSDLLKEFSLCKEEDERMADEPVLVFQRNSFLSLDDEEKQTKESVVTRLFEEARHNILTTRYPIPIPDAEMLGGMLARIKYGPFNAETHKTGFFKKSLSDFLPYYAIGSNKLVQFIRHSSSEQRLLQQYEHASNKSHDVISCQRQFLAYCRSIPFYGCAFFKGSAIQDGVEMKPWKSCEKHVIVGINRLGITLFDGSKEEILIHLPYDDLSWEFIRDEEHEAGDDERKDVFCIEYDTVDEEGEHTPEQVQIISNQACMMDAMVTSCINFMEVMKIPKTPTSADYKKILDISYSTNPSKKQNFSLTRPFKR